MWDEKGRRDHETRPELPEEQKSNNRKVKGAVKARASAAAELVLSAPRAVARKRVAVSISVANGTGGWLGGDCLGLVGTNIEVFTRCSWETKLHINTLLFKTEKLWCVSVCADCGWGIFVMEWNFSASPERRSKWTCFCFCLPCIITRGLIWAVPCELVCFPFSEQRGYNNVDSLVESSRAFYLRANLRRTCYFIFPFWCNSQAAVSLPPRHLPTGTF